MSYKHVFVFTAGAWLSAALAVQSGCISDDNKTSTHHMDVGGAGGTSSGPGMGGNSGSAGDTGSGGSEPLKCNVFCSGMTTTCVGADQMYADTAGCYATCSLMPLGTTTDMMGNTLGCRAHYLSLAKQSGQNADMYCLSAGPGSAGACGTDCDNFCYLAALACTGGNQQWPDMASCKADCLSFPTNEPYTAGAEGDNFACRMYHLTVATVSPQSADNHCGHIAKMSSVCYDMMDAGMGGMGGMGMGGMGMGGMMGTGGTGGTAGGGG